MSTNEELLKMYLATLDEKEIIGYEIARDHLGSSFDLSKSLGYLHWLKTYQADPPPPENK
jgi:hypothetical protein